MSLKDLKSHIYHNYYLGFRDLINKKHFDESPEMKIILDELRENGLVVIENFFEVEKCELYQKEINDKIVEYKDKVWEDSTGSDIRVWGGEDVSEKFKTYHSDNFLHQLCERYLETTIENLITLANRTDFKEGNLGSGGGWHRDDAYHSQFKSIVYLSDVNEKNGPFTYLLGTHKTDNLFDVGLDDKVKKYDFRLDENFIEKVKELGYKEVKCVAKKGTLILADTRGIHRGTPLLEGKRYTMFNYFYPKAHINKKLIDKYDAVRLG